MLLGGVPAAIVLNLRLVPALFLRYSVDRPGTAGAAAPRAEWEPVLERGGGIATLRP